MTAGLISYKLCDRQFDCDGCPLDAALTGSSERRDFGRQGQAKLPEWSFPDDRRYGPAHMWVRASNGGPLRVGIDVLAARLLDRIREVHLPEIGNRLSRGGLLAAVTIHGGELFLPSPVDGLVVDTNSPLQGDPGRLVREPYETGWICAVEAPPASSVETFASASTMRRRLRYELKHFRMRLASYLVTERTVMGRTMADGGEPLTDLRQILGSESYIRLLQEILG